MSFSFLRKLLLLFRPVSNKKLEPISCPQGNFYNLQEIFDRINEKYFEKRIDLAITWFGSPDREAKRRRLLGSYNQKKRLIKIHRLLDNDRFPSYFVSYVIYHEMLHHECPPKARGKRRIHHKTFKEREKLFEEYALAKRWERANRKEFFTLN
jgi:predicted metal-dependent hydrolase